MAHKDNHEEKKAKGEIDMPHGFMGSTEHVARPVKDKINATRSVQKEKEFEPYGEAPRVAKDSVRRKSSTEKKKSYDEVKKSIAKKSAAAAETQRKKKAAKKDAPKKPKKTSYGRDMG